MVRVFSRDQPLKVLNIDEESLALKQFYRCAKAKEKPLFTTLIKKAQPLA